MTDTTSQKAKRNARPWSPEEEETLRLLVAEGKTGKEISQALGRSCPSLWFRARKIGAKLDASPIKWTPEEDEILQRLFPTHSNKQIGDLIGRAKDAVSKRAMLLGITKPRGTRRIGHYSKWSSEQVTALKSMYAQKMDHADIATELGRTLVSVQQKLFSLRLISKERFAPIGFERVNSSGLLLRKISNSGTKSQNWKRVDVIEWEAAFGPIPEGYTLFVANKYLPRTLNNMRLVRKDELWAAITGYHMPPETKELVSLKRQLEREVAMQRRKQSKALTQ